MTKVDLMFIHAAIRVLGWSEEHLARFFAVGTEVLASVFQGQNDSLGERIVCTLLRNGPASPPLLRAARAMLGLTQEQICQKIDIAPGTFKKFENDEFSPDAARKSVKSLAKLLTFFAEQGVSITFNERAGAGVSKRSLRFDTLPGL